VNQPHEGMLGLANRCRGRLWLRGAPRVRLVFRQRARLVKVLGIALAVLLLLSFTLPLILSGR
jgi:hypothetical protein